MSVLQDQPNLDDIFRSRDFAGLRENLSQLTPRELAELIGDAPPHEQAIFFRILPRKLAAATFEYLPTGCGLTCRRCSVGYTQRLDVAAHLATTGI